MDFVEKGGWERVKKREKDRMEEEISALESRKRGAAEFGLPAAQLPSAGVGLGEVLAFLANLFG